jgi:hypothetical protein
MLSRLSVPVAALTSVPSWPTPGVLSVKLVSAVSTTRELGSVGAPADTNVSFPAPPVSQCAPPPRSESSPPPPSIEMACPAREFCRWSVSVDSWLGPLSPSRVPPPIVSEWTSRSTRLEPRVPL